MPVHAPVSPSHFRLWWSFEPRTDLIASSVALGVGLLALGAVLFL